MRKISTLFMFSKNSFWLRLSFIRFNAVLSDLTHAAFFTLIITAVGELVDFISVPKLYSEREDCALFDHALIIQLGI